MAAKTQLTSLVAASLFAFGGTVNADQPMTLTEPQLDTVTAAGGVNFESNVLFNFDLNQAANVNALVNYTTVLELDGETAVADATADAYGFNGTFALTFTEAQTVAPGVLEVAAPGFSQAISKSLAGSDGLPQ